MKRFLVAGSLIIAAACQPNDIFVSTATFVHPESISGEPVPLVILVHGHGGSREEAGGFTRVADALAEVGIASIRMDFPGCGESVEPFTENHLANMLADIRVSRDFAIEHPGIDAKRVGILGYSMGGRLAMLASLKDKYAAMVLWNPVGSDGPDSMIPFLGGRDDYAELREIARRDEAVNFVTPWGDEQRLSRQWFEQMESSMPLSAIGQFEGTLLVLYGEQDKVVNPQVSRLVAASAGHSSSVVLHEIADGDHGLGFYSDNAAVSDEVVSRTVEFFRSGWPD
jgi:dienelactone hydrolase